jgi:hypothetical protein
MKIRTSLVAVFIALATLGMSGLGEAQHVRSTTYRPHHTTYRYAHHPHRYVGYGHPRYYGGVRFGYGWGGYGGVAWGGYYGHRSYVSFGYYPTYQYHGPRFIHYPPRAAVVVVPPIEQVVPAPAEPKETIKLKPGESVERGNVVIANIDGKIVILQAVEDGEAQGQ